jgi:hypothetical protein
MRRFLRQNVWRRLSSLRFRAVFMALRRLESHYRLMVSALFSVASRHGSALPLSPPLLKRIEKPG